MFHLQHTPNRVQALINTQQGRGAHVYCQLDERSRPIDNKYAFMNKHIMHRIIMSCVQKTRINQSILVLLRWDLHKAMLSFK